MLGPPLPLLYKFGVIQHGASTSDGDHWRTKKPSPLAKDVARPVRRRQWHHLLRLQQRDDRVCDKGASTSGGDHVFFRLFVRPYCRSGRETRLLGMERLWGRASPAAAMCACGKVHHAGSPHHQPAVRTFVRQHGHESRAGGSATGGGRRQQVSLCAWGELCVRRQGTALLCMW